jgi:hypothetical protein
LQSLYEQFRPRGFEILAFPCDQFGHQEIIHPTIKIFAQSVPGRGCGLSRRLSREVLSLKLSLPLAEALVSANPTRRSRSYGRLASTGALPPRKFISEILDPCPAPASSPKSATTRTVREHANKQQTNKAPNATTMTTCNGNWLMTQRPQRIEAAWVALPVWPSANRTDDIALLDKKKPRKVAPRGFRPRPAPLARSSRQHRGGQQHPFSLFRPNPQSSDFLFLD